MTLETLVDRLMAQFDTTQATVVSVVNERLKELIVQAKWATAEQSLGTTVADQAAYPLDADLADVRSVRVGSDLYAWAGEDEIDAVTSSADKWAGASFDANGVRKLQLFPVPTVTGTSITALTHTIPADLSYGTATALGIPDDMVRYLRAGCQAELYEEIDERPDLAAPREQVFVTGIQRLRARANSQVRPGVSRVRVQTYDFDLR